MGFLNNLFINQNMTAIAFYLTIIIAICWSVFAKPKRKRIVTPLRILFVGTFVAAICHYMPVFLELLSPKDSPTHWMDAFLSAIQYSVKMFTLGGDIMWVQGNSELFESPSFVMFIASIMYIVAPLFTFGVILSFFNNLTTEIKYRLFFFARAHIFSELNEKSIALATDIKNKSNRLFGIIPLDVIVFTEASEKNAGVSTDLLNKAFDIGALTFQKNLTALKLKHKNSSRKVTAYLISEDEDKKLLLAEHIMSNYDQDDVTLYIFSYEKRSELMISSASPQKMRAMRVNDIQSLVYHNLDMGGRFLFDNAREIDGEKVISVIIVGLGKYGREMLKALTWFCQLDGYKLKINAFDSDKNAEEKLKFECPELMSDKYNGKKLEGEPYYSITVHQDIDVTTDKFRKELISINDATYVFVCLGTDEQNIKVATDIRSIYEAIDCKPDIETVVYDSDLARKMGVSRHRDLRKAHEGVCNYKGQAYNIIMTGDLESFYSSSTLFNTRAEAEGLKLHMRWNDKNSFWKYDYNYKSSIAKAIHINLREQMGQPLQMLTDDEWNALSCEQKVAHANLEHKRWNAYMRAEGYSWGGSTEKPARNDLAKLHNCLVPTQNLPDKELSKD